MASREIVISKIAFFSLDLTRVILDFLQLLAINPGFLDCSGPLRFLGFRNKLLEQI